ncbi:MAG TPA: ROK family transcriptional regulator [Streptosporangiaceae bacterium]
MNQRLLLDLLFASGPATRPQLGQAAGLSQPTVIAALADLEKLGLVRPCGRTTSAPGRAPMLYEINPSAGAVVGVDIGREWIRLMVTDLAGNRLSQLEVRNTAADRSGLVDAVGQLVSKGTADAGLQPEQITHTVIGSPGVYDTGRSQLLYAANLPGWLRSRVVKALDERFGSAVTIDNDANLAALGEYTYGAGKAVRHFVYLTIGTGVGLGIVIDGQLYRGSSGSAGEVGYLPVGDELPLTPRRRPQRGMLEESFGSEAVVRRAREAGMKGTFTAEDVFTAARHGDAHARAVVITEAQMLARVVSSICALLDPELIVVGGGIGQNLDLLEPEMTTELARLTPMRPALGVGDLDRDAVVLGAIAMGIQYARETLFESRAGK